MPNEYVLVVAFGSSHIYHEYVYRHIRILHKDVLGSACGLDFNQNGLLPVRRSDLGDLGVPYRACKRCESVARRAARPGTTVTMPGGEDANAV